MCRSVAGHACIMQAKALTCVMQAVLVRATRSGMQPAIENTEVSALNAQLTDHSDYTASITVDQAPAEVFQAASDPRLWWSQNIEGATDSLGAVFYYHFKDVHRGTFQVTESVPGQRLVWHVLQNHFNFVKDPTEWTGTDIVFDITKKGDKTELRFTHVGLEPA